MKRILLIISLGVFLITGCDDVEPITTEPYVSIKYDGFDLVADPYTGILYIDNEFRSGGKVANTYHIYTPYYSENGNLCKYEDDRIIEIKKENEE